MHCVIIKHFVQGISEESYSRYIICHDGRALYQVSQASYGSRVWLASKLTTVTSLIEMCVGVLVSCMVSRHIDNHPETLQRALIPLFFQPSAVKCMHELPDWPILCSRLSFWISCRSQLTHKQELATAHGNASRARMNDLEGGFAAIAAAVRLPPRPLYELPSIAGVVDSALRRPTMQHKQFEDDRIHLTYEVKQQNLRISDNILDNESYGDFHKEIYCYHICRKGSV